MLVRVAAMAVVVRPAVSVRAVVVRAVSDDVGEMVTAALIWKVSLCGTTSAQGATLSPRVNRRATTRR